jgi:RNA polymerase sigma factor (sigma-70 family)
MTDRVASGHWASRMGLPEESDVHGTAAVETLRPFAQLYADQFRFVWSLAARLGVPPAQREDVAQEVWLTVHRRLHTLRPEASARGWVAAITRKVASRHHRTHHRAERKLAALAEVEGGRRSPTGERDSFALVDDALARMDPTQRDVFLLAHVEELSGPEIAEVVGAPLNTVYSRLRLARARLCEYLAQVEGEEEAIVDAIRRRDAPPRGASSRVWLMVSAGLGKAVSVPLVTGAIATKLAITSATAATVVMLAVGVGAAAEDPIADTPPAVTAPREVSVESSRQRAIAPAAAMTTVERPDTPTPASAKALDPVPTARPSRSPAAPPARRTAEPIADTSTIAAESKLVGDARRELATGDARRAIALLDEHSTKFPRGTMGIEARALRVRSLCAIGSVAEAERIAAALVAEFPGSPSAVGVRDACETPSTGKP